MDIETRSKCCQALCFFPEGLSMEENPIFLRKFDYFANLLQTFYPKAFSAKKIIKMILFDEVSLETGLPRRGLDIIEELQTIIDYILYPSGTNLIRYSHEIGKKREQIQKIFNDIQIFISKSPNYQYKKYKDQGYFYEILEDLDKRGEIFNEKHENVPISKNLQNISAFYLENPNLCNYIVLDSEIWKECFEPIREKFSSEQILGTTIPNNYFYMEEERNIFATYLKY